MVEVAETGFDRGEFAPLDGLHVLLEIGLEQLADVDEVAEAFPAAEALDQLLRAGEDGIDLRGRLVGKLEDAGGSVDQAAIGAVALDDLGIELDTHARGQLTDDVAQVALPAHLFEALVAAELVRDRDLIDRFVSAPKVDGRFVNPGVLLTEEVRGIENRGDLVDRLGIDEQCRDDRFFGLDIVRGEAFE